MRLDPRPNGPGRCMLLLIGCLAGCTGTIDGGPGDAGPTQPFEPIGPSSYVPKVKNLLVGLAATDAEVQAVVDDPKALRGLIDQWMTLPEFKGKMVDFFRNAFQQNHASLQFLADNVGLDINTVSGLARLQLERSMMDSFALTAWELVNQGRPFNETITTDSYMLNPPLMSLLSYIDEIGIGDTGGGPNRLATRRPLDHYSLDLGPSTLATTLDPASPGYMVWHGDHVKPCTDPPVLFGNGSVDAIHQDLGYPFYLRLRKFIFGEAYGTTPYEAVPCYGATNGVEISSQFSDADWSAWRMVKIRPTDTTTPDTAPLFWNILEMRTAPEMRLHVPRIGFMGTLAFAANWGTNAGNSARVTANQSLIVAIGRSINGQGAPAGSVEGLDAQHASSPECAGCHAQLDPYRQFFRQSYSLFYHEQSNQTQIAQAASFNIGIQATSGKGIGDVTKILAAHPRFPLAWVQKLHFWANNLPALESDPEVARIAMAFQDSNFDFKTLVRELFSSPLITFAGPTDTTVQQGVILSIARSDHYCASLSNRLGISDVCGLKQATPSASQTAVLGPASMLPIDTYYRASELPSLPTSPDLFFRASVERICGLVAAQVIDAGPVSRYDSAKPDEAITDFVTTVMALVPSDPRATAAATILTDNFTQATATGVSAAEALKATFITACIAPSSVIVGL